MSPDLHLKQITWQVDQLTKHDNRIDPQEAPTSLLFKKFLNLQRYTVVSSVYHKTSPVIVFEQREAVLSKFSRVVSVQCP